MAVGYSQSSALFLIESRNQGLPKPAIKPRPVLLICGIVARIVFGCILFGFSSLKIRNSTIRVIGTSLRFHAIGVLFL